MVWKQIIKERRNIEHEKNNSNDASTSANCIVGM